MPRPLQARPAPTAPPLPHRPTGADDEGLDASRLLAEALAAGIMAAPRDARAAGIDWPDSPLVEQARLEQQEAVLRSQAEGAAEEAAAAAARTEAGARDDGLGGVSAQGQRLGPGFGAADGPVSGADDLDLRQRQQMGGSIRGASGAASMSSGPASDGGGKRAWGSGLKGLASKARPAPRSQAAAPAAGAAAPDGQQGRKAPAARTLTRAELAAIAERQGLDLEVMLADAEARGIAIADDEE
jgi:hypothetical protein